MRIRSMWTLARKDLTVTARSPLFALLSVLVPVAFTLLYAIVIHVSTTATIAVADQDHTPRSAQLIQTMTDLHNSDGHFYEILSIEPGQAKQLYDTGRVGALLTVPPGFGAGVDAGTPPDLVLSLVNINADGTKNQHLRLEQTLRTFRSNVPGLTDSPLQVSETTVLDHDIPITIYLGSALIAFAALYTGLVNVGVGIAREWEERTAKTLVLSPVGSMPLVVGKWIAGAVVSAGSLLITTCGIGAILGYPVLQLGWHSAGVLLIFWIYGAGLGAVLGVTLRKSLPLIPVAVIIAVAHFLISGYESYIRGFAHGGAAEALWHITSWIPLAPLFDIIRFEVAGLPTPPSALVGVLGTLAITVCWVGLATWRLTRAIRFTQGQ